VMKLEIPYSPELVEAVWLAAGGSILAGQSALRDGFGANLGGGFHHAYPGHGEGFCAIHDVAVAVRRLQADKAIERAIVVDTDVHHGNGTAAIFRDDSSVFTLSIHQENNYPAHKPPSSVDLNMWDRADDEEYLGALVPAVQKALDEFKPDILFYVGGADPYEEDQLGGLSLTKKGLMERDRSVFREARRREIPVATALAGGYARRVEDTVPSGSRDEGVRIGHRPGCTRYFSARISLTGPQRLERSVVCPLEAETSIRYEASIRYDGSIRHWASIGHD
jgi:acetoin utilization deacetylase AcuC-like enzyme